MRSSAAACASEAQYLSSKRAAVVDPSPVVGAREGAAGIRSARAEASMIPLCRPRPTSLQRVASELGVTFRLQAPQDQARQYDATKFILARRVQIVRALVTVRVRCARRAVVDDHAVAVAGPLVVRRDGQAVVAGGVVVGGREVARVDAEGVAAGLAVGQRVAEAVDERAAAG